MPHNGRRSADERLLTLLACGMTVEAAAQQAGVGPATVYRRLRDPGFRQRLQRVRADFVQRTAGTMTAAATEAVRTLLELQKAPSPPAVRLGAARAVLEIGMKVREAADLEERLAALEERLANDGGRGR
jgi:DNA-binding MurR/RpiR family transcriptional regulator